MCTARIIHSAELPEDVHFSLEASIQRTDMTPQLDKAQRRLSWLLSLDPVDVEFVFEMLGE